MHDSNWKPNYTIPWTKVFSLFFAGTLLATATPRLALANYDLEEFEIARALDFPLKDPYQATLLSVPLHPSTNIKFKERKLTLFQDRSNLKNIGTRNRVFYTYALQANTSAPLIYVIPGLGGYAQYGTSQFLAEKLFQMGYSVVTMPSSTHWSFALAASKSGRPGYLPEDSKDMYFLMSVVKKQLVREHRILPTSYSVLGYSYGALEAAALNNRDFNQNQFHFKKVILLSPPLDRSYTMGVLDHNFTIGDRWSAEKRFALVAKATGSAIELGKKSVEEILQERAIEKLRFTDDQIAWLLAVEFRRTLSETLYVSQEISDDGLLPPQGSLSDQGRRRKVAKEFGFGDYLTKIVMPSLEKQLLIGAEQILASNSLKSILSQQEGRALKSNQIVVFHNHDDFLSFPGTQETNEVISDIGSGYFNLSTYGGHLGNMWDPDFLADLRQSLRSL